MRSVDGQLDSPTADFTLHSTQLHAQYVEQFESQSSGLSPPHPLIAIVPTMPDSSRPIVCVPGMVSVPRSLLVQ